MSSRFKFIATTTLALMAFGQVAVAQVNVVEIPTGPINDLPNAAYRCAQVCRNLRWNGQWWQSSDGSVCQTTQGVDVLVTPHIWNTADAQRRCPTDLAKFNWSGQWRTIVPNESAVCGCYQQ